MRRGRIKYTYQAPNLKDVLTDDKSYYTWELSVKSACMHVDIQLKIHNQVKCRNEIENKLC